MTWNYRMCAGRYKGIVVFTIRSVYYDDDGNLEAYSVDGKTSAFESAQLGEDYSLYKDFNIWRKQIQKAMDKPIIDLDNWPNEFKFENEK